MAMSSTTRRAYSVDEVAEMYGLTRKTIAKLIRCGDLDAINIGGVGTAAHYRIPVAALAKFEASRAVRVA